MRLLRRITFGRMDKTVVRFAKVCSLLLSLVMLPIPDALCAVAAETMTDEELMAYAEEKGVLTDTFSFPNHGLEDMEREVKMKIIQDASYNLSKINCWSTDAASMSQVLSNGVCFGMAALTVLTHNGVVTLNEIQPDAENLHEITLDNEVDYLLGRFSIAQCYTAMSNYLMSHVQNTSSEERVRELLETAEKCDAEGKYFLIGLQMSPPRNGAHSVTGLGVADGDWVWNEKHYDKCILVSDPNGVKDGAAIPCAAKACIYINSETNTFYLPVYETSSEENGQITMAIDDPELLLYHAPLHPVDEPTAFTGHNYTRVTAYGMLQQPSDIQVQRADGTSYSLLDGADAFFLHGLGRSRYAEGDLFTVYVPSNGNLDLAVYADQYIARCGISDNGIADEPDDVITLDQKQVHIRNNGSQAKTVSMVLGYNDVPYSDTMNYFNFQSHHLLNGNEDIQLNSLQDGIGITTTQNQIWGEITLNSMNYYETFFDPSREQKEAQTEYIHISASKVLFQYNDATKELEQYIDSDQDGTCETKIQKGDTNGDGIPFDVADAQLTLMHYVNKLSKVFVASQYVNLGLADIDNDQTVSVADAQLILNEYVNRLALNSTA